MPDSMAWGELAQVLSGATAALTVLVGGIVGLRRYQHGLKIKAAELLLVLEEEFRSILPTLVRWDVGNTYRRRVAPLIGKYMAGEPLGRDEVADLIDLDRALRFFYVCTVLHGDLRIEQDVLARSYYWYANQLLDHEARPELHAYVERYFKRLHRWLVCHEPCFARYRKDGEWVEGLSLPFERALARRGEPEPAGAEA